MQHYGAPFFDPSQEIQALLIQKGSLAAVGDLRGAREIDLAVRRLAHEANLPFDIDATKILLDDATANALTQEAEQGRALLQSKGIPSWFRPGYSVQVRVATWERLRPSFHERMQLRHDRGLLDMYFPAPSFLAKLIKPSDFMYQQSTDPADVAEAVAVAQQTVNATAPGGPPVLAGEIIQAMDSVDANAAVVADLEQELAGEAADASALAESLAAEGPSVLAVTAPWYEDNRKVLYAALAGLVLFSVVRK